MSEELWRPIPGFEGVYEVSSHGQVRSMSGEFRNQHVGNKVGHRRVLLNRPSGGRVQQYVHRLVLLAFVGPCPEGMQCCHNDGDAGNNRLENLRWDTPSSNMYDKVKHGTHHHTNRTHCPKGHPLDAIKYHGDGTFWQRRCRTCLREQNRAKKARKMTCPQGHPFDGVAYKPDGSVRQRFCKQCRAESVSRQMTARHEATRNRTHCDQGHPLDGVRKRAGAPDTKFCKTCRNDASRRKYAAKQAVK